MLPLLLIILLSSGFFSLYGPNSLFFQKTIALVGIAIALVICVTIGVEFLSSSTQAAPWLYEWQMPWISTWDINVHFGLDVIAWWLIALTIVMGIIACFFAHPDKNLKSYFASISWAVFAVVGLLASVDIFLFFIFWELSLLPVYWMMLFHGKEESRSSSMRYIFYTQLSGFILLLSVIGLAYYNFQSTNIFTFSYAKILSVPIDTAVQPYLFLGFLLAFLIKLPSVPFHGWIAGVFNNAPAPIILVGLLIKTAIFGLMRFSWPLFPDACTLFAQPIMYVGVISIFYGAIVAFGQRNPTSLLAYGTLSHAGMLLVGLFSSNQASFLGVMFLLICQTFSTASLLLIVRQLSPVDLRQNYGLWEKNPILAVIILFFSLASLGFPVFGNFIGEWMVVWGTFSAAPVISILVALGMVLGAIYSLWLFQRLCWGSASDIKISAYTSLDNMMYGLIVVALLVAGFFPNLILNSFDIASSLNIETQASSSLKILHDKQVALP
ncbi:MAG: NADH-quinone oxidoreductase subunit M [Myxococcales bacterium]|nr:NADH-quinone oxidoreductase subunit M [Myxococcales bacterium]USN50859.1 MAG: NADH-quinone oxidoreductase subunit M [Myxococcales bacterium]